MGLPPHGGVEDPFQRAGVPSHDGIQMADKNSEQASSQERRVILNPICPACQKRCRRSRRRGLIDFLRGLLGWYPWRCEACSVRYFLRCRF